MPTQEEIGEQQRLLATHRKTLSILLAQKARHTSAHTPPSVEHGIYEARIDIGRVKNILHDWDVHIIDHPDDEERFLDASADTDTKSSRTQFLLIDQLKALLRLKDTLLRNILAFFETSKQVKISILLLIILGGLFISMNLNKFIIFSTSKEDFVFNDELIPLNIVQAYPVFAAVDSVKKIEFYLKPEIQDIDARRARGTVTLINTIGQDIPLPKDTEFSAVNGTGKEVRFVIDNSAVIPKAITESTLTGSSTNYGSIDIAVTAQVNGDISNIDSNTITKILIPGQQPINNGMFLLIRHGPISGGNDKHTYTYVLTEKDLQWLRDKSLTDLFDEGLQRLRVQADKYGNALDLVGITPDQVGLKDPKNYELSFDPPIGQPIDPSNTTISVTVRTKFAALAVPRDHPLAEQLELVLPEYFRQYSKFSCNTNDKLFISIHRLSWSGTQLLVDGVIRCSMP